MSAEVRNVSIKLGKSTYTLQTKLDDAAIENLARVMGEITSKLDEKVPQEDQLAIICMTLGWKLDRASKRLRTLIDTMEEIR